MNINPTRYILTVQPKCGTPYNPAHDAVEGQICSVLDVRPGERGWLNVFEDVDQSWHRLHTSTVESISYHSNDDDIVIVTKNSVYRLKDFSKYLMETT